MLLIKKHTAIPTSVGINIAKNVHFQLPVSFFIVRHVVEHGQCINENIIVHNAVTYVQPFSTNMFFSSTTFDISTISPVAIYDISIIGTTISYAEQFCK